MNIFYSNVNTRLRQELNLRGQAGIRRNTADLDFMLGKIANVEIIAFETGSSESKQVGKLGGDSVTTDARYFPTTNGVPEEDGYMPRGFLMEPIYQVNDVLMIDKDTGLASKETGTEVFSDQSYLIGPYITSAEVKIGDHSMGLLNKATIMFTIPNPIRDLDLIEPIWFRPGRYVQVKMEYPESAIINSEKTLDMTGKDFPDDKKLLELYPSWKDVLEKKKTEIASMNSFKFEGLITSFDFSYNENGQVDATISLTGTSNVYTDVAMYLPGAAEIKPAPPKTTGEVTLDPPITTPVPSNPNDPNTSPSLFLGKGQSSFYDLLYTTVDERIRKATGTSTPAEQGCVLFSDKSAGKTDQLIIFGSPYSAIEAYKNSVVEEYNFNRDNIERLYGPTSPKPDAQTLATQSALIEKNRDSQLKTAPTDNNYFFSRYITLGALIHFINEYPIANISSSLPKAQIMCDDIICKSNAYEYMVSCMPDAVLFLPKSTYGELPNSAPNQYDPETGRFAYYEYVSKNMAEKSSPDLKNGYTQWPGVLNTDETTINAINAPKAATILYPSRILINMDIIRSILLGDTYDTKTKQYSGGMLTEFNPSFKLKDFLTRISGLIYQASGTAYNMQLVTHPSNLDLLIFTDSKYINRPIQHNPKDEIVTAYSVPMLSNHPYGTVVKSFKFDATLPDSVKNLSYVLNQDPAQISELDIAPYMNFMYNSNNAEAYNRLVTEYSTRHKQAIQKLQEARAKLGAAPKFPEYVKNLRKCLSTYIMYPTNNIKDTQQITAPMFPFTAEFTIDGIHGFKYGDVLQFEALPKRYTQNTVFCIIEITHTVGSNGMWETAIRTIMRPNIQ